MVAVPVTVSARSLTDPNSLKPKKPVLFVANDLRFTKEHGFGNVASFSPFVLVGRGGPTTDLKRPCS
jgi:hypothetical protein